MEQPTANENETAKRRRGAPTGNKNGLKHGKFTMAARAMRLSVTQPDKFQAIAEAVIEAAQHMPPEKRKLLRSFFGRDVPEPRIRRA